MKVYTNYQIKIVTTVNNIINLSFVEDVHYGVVNVKNTASYEFNYYNGEYAKITIICKYLHTNFKIYIKEHEIPIKQLHMNAQLKITFMEDMQKMYNLVEYNNDYEPAIFYGLMTNDDITVLEKNKSLKIIIWIGGDINYLINRSDSVAKNIKANVDRILKIPKVKHISISSFISNSLINLRLPFKMVPFMGIDFSKYKPIQKGPSIYLYTAIGAEKYYGIDMYAKLIEKYKHINFIVTCCWLSYQEIIKNPKMDKYGTKYYTKEELINNVYPKCFIGLRLTDHDGLSATVQELGLMGIKCVHNGSSPSTLNYKTFEDICQHIDSESLTIGKKDVELSETVSKYLTIDPKFFNSTYH